MSYAAYVVELKNVRKHPNADRLQLASCMGDQVVVGLAQKDGDVGIYFPTDGQLSDEFCTANNLYSKSAAQKLGRPDPKTYGFFDINRRVRAQTFRGEKSEGFWLPLPQALSYADGPAPTVGDKLTEWGGLPLCNKYVTSSTKLNREGGLKGSRLAKKGELVGFPKHYDTRQFRYEVDQIPVGSLIYITEKLHGTSHRVGNVGTKTDPSWWKRLLLGHQPSTIYSVEHGTRNVVIGQGSGEGYYGSDQFRFNATSYFTPHLHKGEVVYGELVGYYGPSQLIMPSVEVPSELDKIKSHYGDKIAYTYGCVSPMARFYVYRIVQFNEDGHGVDLPWPQVKRRAQQLGIETVPEIDGPWVMAEDWHDLADTVELLVDGPSLLDNTHLREGVCVRVETPSGHIYTLKHKSFAFKVLEGIIKLDDSVVDMEEAA